MSEPVNPETRPPLTLAEWLEDGYEVPVAPVSPPVSGVPASALSPPSPVWVLQEAAALMSQLGERAGAPRQLVTSWTTEMLMTARRLEDAEDDARAARERRDSVWSRRQQALASAVAALVHDPAWRLYRWAQARDDSWDD